MSVVEVMEVGCRAGEDGVGVRDVVRGGVEHRSRMG